MKRATRLAQSALPFLLPLVLIPSAFSQQAFKVGTVSAQPGANATGFPDVPPGSDAGMRIPVVVIQGESRGQC